MQFAKIFGFLVSLLPSMALSQNETVTAWGRLGIGEPVIENAILKPGWTVDGQLDRILSLRPKLFRLWIPSGFLYDENGKRTDYHLPTFRRAVDRLHAAGIPIMGMDHSFPSWMTGAEPRDENWNTIPCRSTDPNSAYRKFLRRYETHWREIARLFPEIGIWEPANETNAREVLKPIQVGAGSCGKRYFSFDERVIINIELMEHAKRGISARSKALVFMPPPAPVHEDGSNDPSLRSIERFIRATYAAIASWGGSARSYFDGVSWHPYTFQMPTYENWVMPNDAIRKVMLDYGDHNVPVIFSEVGNSELNYDPATGGLVRKSPEELAVWMQESLRLSQMYHPWLTHIIWFRALDDASSASWGGEHQVRFGIMTEDYPTLSAKPSAHIFCKFTGCVPEAFKAWDVRTGWATFWVHGKHYCRYASSKSYTDLTGMDFNASLPYLAAIDPSDLTYVGACQ